jgi:A/G-specific adenine glycosylase
MGRSRRSARQAALADLPSELRSTLLRWYDRHRRDLPWRRTADPYAIWVSEVMLQQTQVSVVIPYWETFLHRFPDVPALASAPLDEVLAAWRGLGYYARARNLHRAAQALLEKHGGRLPPEVEALGALPGFGRYTVGAVGSIAFGLPVPLVDGNVARVLARLFALEGSPGNPAWERTLWRLAAALVVGERPGDWNQALMELGATVCRPEQPVCLLCPVRIHCRALASGRVDAIPAVRPRAHRRPLHLAVAVMRRGDAVLLVRRPEIGLFGGLWELPSTESTPGEEAAALAARWPGACPARRAREAHLPKRANGFPSRYPQHLGTVTRTLTHRELTLAVFEVEPPARSIHGARWMTADQARSIGVSAAMQAVLALAFDGAVSRRRSRVR